MYTLKFAHMSDIHLGAFRDPIMRQLERQALEDAVKKCIELQVDFLLISGDIFHVSIPDLTIVNETIRSLRLLQNAKIPVYAIYGSHDYTPNGTSIIDILDTAGILTNVMKARMDDEGYVLLDFVTDPKTGAKLTGVSARRIGLESKLYEKLDKNRLELEKGFKIFAFHSGITEFKPSFLSEMETVKITSFPRGFAYYAGGHIHITDEFTWEGYPRVVFPGPLFTGYGKDIEDTARGTKRGFYVVDFDEKVNKVEFVEIRVFDGAYVEYDASGKNSHQARKELSAKLDGLDANGKLVVVRVKGELAGGKTTDIDFGELGRRLSSKGATFVYFNRFSLSSKEYEASKIAGEDPAQIEANLFRENIGAVKVSQPNLKGQEGVQSAMELLKATRNPQKSGETKGDYSSRIVASGIEALKLQKEFESEKK
ncbi:MAG: exonuclease SbcCD subunit D [Thaumarchaeota archaeon]|nr:exonuclease SbcCD subunit D [Nitrososphaerota archaeon]